MSFEGQITWGVGLGSFGISHGGFGGSITHRCGEVQKNLPVSKSTQYIIRLGSLILTQGFPQFQSGNLEKLIKGLEKTHQLSQTTDL